MMKLYQEQIDEARNAWNAFKTASAASSGPTSEVDEALVAALSRIQATLQRSPEPTAC